MVRAASPAAPVSEWLITTPIGPCGGRDPQGSDPPDRGGWQHHHGSPAAHLGRRPGRPYRHGRRPDGSTGGAKDVELVLCGVRGSTPAPGAAYVRTGGHTSCVAIRARDDRWLVLDAGTGIRRLGSMLGDAPLRGSILLTHLHWDHTQGLPFVPQADRPDAEVRPLPAAPSPRRRRGIGVRPGDVAPPLPHRPRRPAGRLDLPIARRRHAHASRGSTSPRPRSPTRAVGRSATGIDDGEATIAYLPDHAPAIADARATRRRDRAGPRRRPAPPRRAVRRGGARHRRRVRPRHHRRRRSRSPDPPRSHELVLIHHAPARTDDRGRRDRARRRCRPIDRPDLRRTRGRRARRDPPCPDQMRS